MFYKLQIEENWYPDCVQMDFQTHEIVVSDTQYEDLAEEADECGFTYTELATMEGLE